MKSVRVGMSVVFGALALAACGPQQEDATEFLTGTESQPIVVMTEDGGTAFECPADKELVCHVPPGNPANEHSICIGKPAVKAHLKNHPDYLGPCDSEVGEPQEPVDAGTDVEIDAGTPDEGVDAGEDGGIGDGEQIPDAGSDEVDAGVIN